MPDDISAISGAGSAPSDGTPSGLGAGTPGSGQPGSTPAGESQAPATATPPGQAPQGTPKKPLFATVEDAERDYKALQRQFTRATQVLADLGDIEAIRQEREFLESLRSDPEFQEWAQARIAKAKAGSADPETIRALEIVQSIVDEVTEQKVAPFREMAHRQKTAAVFSAMDKEFGGEWRQYRPQMQRLLVEGIQSGYFHPNVEYDFDHRFVRGLYQMAVASDPNYAAKKYQEKLAQKSSQVSTATPGTSPNAQAPAKVNSIAEAFAAAKKQMGLA